MNDKPKTMTDAEIEEQIRRNMASIRRKKPSGEQLEAEYRKYKGIYQAAVLDDGSTVGPYIWKEVYRRLLGGKK